MKNYTITVNGTAYSVTVEEGAASVPGKVFQIPSSVGDAVSAGDTIIVLESMKMEIPVVAPESGTIASINVTVGAQVETGDLLATLN